MCREKIARGTLSMMLLRYISATSKGDESMTHRHHGCGPRGRFEINLPEGLMAMRGGRGWQGNWGPFHFDFGEDGWSGGRGRGRRSRRMFEGGELRLVLLKLI